MIGPELSSPAQFFCKKSQTFKTSIIFLNLENFENIFFLPEKILIFLVLPIVEISLGPELSNLACFRIQGWVP